MSVLASRRKESRLEPIIFSIELHESITELAQRDFGVKDLDQLVRVRYANGIDKYEDFGRYRGLMRLERDKVDQLCFLLTNNLRAANSIYPTSMQEYEKRREYQNFGIVNCEQLIKELQRVVELFNVDIGVYERCVKAVNREIDLIKRWRQRDNKIKSYLQGNI
jgi:hypothetical protein